MIEKIDGIVLDVRHHNDKHNVVTLYSRQRGRVAFVCAASGKKGVRNNALLRPLALIECNVSFRSGRELNTLSDYTTSYIFEELYYDPNKTAVSLFIADFLNCMLRSSAAETSLFDYIVDSVKVLDSAPPRMTADFHIVFLVSMLYFAGIQPDLSSYVSGWRFDMRQGCFTEFTPLHNDVLDVDESAFIVDLMRINFLNSRCFRFDRNQRNYIIDKMVRYFSLHIPGISSVNSTLDVLRELMK